MALREARKMKVYVLAFKQVTRSDSMLRASNPEKEGVPN